MEQFSLAGKTALVTGASSGFGHHFAGLLAENGARVVLGARRLDKIQARVDALTEAGHEVLGLTLDVRDPASAQNFLSESVKAFGGIDILINNAGVEAGAKTYTMIDDEDWDYVFDTNLKAAWRSAPASATSAASPLNPASTFNDALPFVDLIRAEVELLPPTLKFPGIVTAPSDREMLINDVESLVMENISPEYCMLKS